MRTTAIGMSLAIGLGLLVVPLPRDVAIADCRQSISLSATPDGEDVGASGRAQIRSSDLDDVQELTVEAGAAVPDGTSLFVFANGRPAGAFALASGVGTLDLVGEAGRPLAGGVDSVCSLGPIWVTDANGKALLSGSF